MRRSLRVRKAARAEIAEAFAWYRARSGTAADRFLDAVDEAMERIETDPEQYHIVHGRLRRVLLAHFPYGIYYKVYPAITSVVGVIHERRHPDTWLRRIAP